MAAGDYEARRYFNRLYACIDGSGCLDPGAAYQSCVASNCGSYYNLCANDT